MIAPSPCQRLGLGEVGYLITGVKDVGQSRVGDTVTDLGTRQPRPSPGTRSQADGLLRAVPVDGSEYPDLREALDSSSLTTPR